MMEKTDAESRFFSRIEKDEESKCWNWIGSIQPAGYGQFIGDGKPGTAHRWAYKHWKGDISSGFVIDHLCRNRRCVNPDHLEAVSQAENIRRWKAVPVPTAEHDRHLALVRAQLAELRTKTDATINRFFNRVRIVPDGCWEWVGRKNPAGYAMFMHVNLAHRWAYQRFLRPIPEGFQIDHLCRVRHCVNPWHLEAVTPRENTLRSESPSALNAIKTHCPMGHALKDNNLYLDRRGGRSCKECRREALRRSRANTKSDPTRLAEYRRKDSERQLRYRIQKKGRPLDIPNRDKTHCPHGHEYTEENTFRESNGSRKCRTCVREANLRAYRKRKGMIESSDLTS